MSPLPLLLAIVMPAFCEDARPAPPVEPESPGAQLAEAAAACTGALQARYTAECAQPSHGDCRLLRLLIAERTADPRVSDLALTPLRLPEGREGAQRLLDRHEDCGQTQSLLLSTGESVRVRVLEICAEYGPDGSCLRTAQFIERPADEAVASRIDADFRRPRQGASSRLQRLSEQARGLASIPMPFGLPGQLGVDDRSPVRRRAVVGWIGEWRF
ncbi:MAG: hypothetical protein SF051_12135 [Elusimicrobiota bacterium]|nr:hypothetical protein [Elusimicrobiota bacterium]